MGRRSVKERGLVPDWYRLEGNTISRHDIFWITSLPLFCVEDIPGFLMIDGLEDWRLDLITWGARDR